MGAWYVVRSDDKKRARLNVIRHLLDISRTRSAARKVELPKRQKPHGYKEPDYPYKFVPELLAGRLGNPCHCG